MFGSQYYHGTIRKYVVAFGNLFDDIVINRLDKEGNRIQSIAVPLAYGPKEKFLVRITQDPNFDQSVALTLPRLGFEITTMTYAPQRKLSSTLREYKTTTDGDNLDAIYVPVPYDIQFVLSVFSANADDAMQILEQIVPYFRPEYTTNVILIPEMDISVDTPIVLESLDLEDTYDGDFETRRALIHNLTFSLKGYIYGPKKTSGVIKRAINNIYNDEQLTEKIQTLGVQPALYANGSPLFVPSGDPNDSISLSLINADDDYGFAKDIT